MMELFVAFLLMLLVLLCCYLVTKSIAIGSLGKQKGRLIKIVDRQMIAQDKLLVVAKVGEKSFLIAFSGNSACLVSELDANCLNDEVLSSNQGEGQKFNSVLSKLLEKQDKKDGESY